MGIYCLYEASGKIGESDKNTIIELRSVVDNLVIVINGVICHSEELNKYADNIIYRENTGLDIGAYKRVILSDEYKDEIGKYEELVLCNNSFYGPFIPFEKIFEEMEESKADFWGISSSEKNLVQHIQSYFLVLRQNIIKEETLFYYLDKWVDEQTIDYYSACSVFENGLFWMLKKAGYMYDAFKRDIDCNNYFNPYGSVKIDKLPILKKKIFSKEFYDKEQAINALFYIMKNYMYDITCILDDASFNYGIKISMEDVSKNKVKKANKDLFQRMDMVGREEVEEFISSQKRVYIYGNGKIAKHIYSCFFFREGNPALQGFVVSDDQSLKEKCFRGYPIYKYSELKDIEEIALLIALNKENTKEIINNLNENNKIKILWKE